MKRKIHGRVGSLRRIALTVRLIRLLRKVNLEVAKLG